MQVFLSCWIRLYGMVCMEVFGHLRFALDDAEPMFEAELRACEVLGVADPYASSSGLTEYRRPPEPRVTATAIAPRLARTA